MAFSALHLLHTHFVCSRNREPYTISSAWRVSGGQTSSACTVENPGAKNLLSAYITLLTLTLTLHICFNNFQTFEALTFVNIHIKKKITKNIYLKASESYRGGWVDGKFGGRALKGKVVLLHVC